MIDRRNFLQSAAALGGLAIGVPAAAQIPATTILWSGFPPGGLGDQVTRPLIERMRGRYPSNLVYDSKVGAGGRIAADFVKRSAPDGGNLLQAPGSIWTLYPHVYKKLTYDALADFVPITPVCSFTFVFTAGPGLPAEIKTLADYLKWAKANPASANYGIPSLGTSLHFAGMLLARGSGVDLKSVPYRGGGPLLQDLMGGQVPISFNVVSEVLPHIRSGKLRALAVTSAQRWSALPDTPSFSELGFKDIAMTEWLGWFGPAKTPDSVVRPLNAATREAIQTPEMTDVFNRNGLVAMNMTPEEFGQLVRRDYDYWAGVVKATGFTAEE